MNDQNVRDALTNIGQTHKWLDQLEGEISNLRTSSTAGIINGQNLIGYMRKIEEDTRPIMDSMRVALLEAQKLLT